jgi:predicted nucleotidyltransferase
VSAPDVAPLVEAVRLALEPVAAVRIAYVFGSRVTGGARPDSDLDVAVLYDRSLDGRARELARREVIVALADALGTLGERTDVLDLDAADSSIAFAVVHDGRRALVRDPAERVSFEALTFRRYDDDAPRRTLFRDAVAKAARRVAGAGGRGR